MSAATRFLKDCRAAFGNAHPRTVAAFQAVVAEKLKHENASPKPGTWYVSFATTKANGGFLGGCFVDGIGPVDVIQKTKVLGINPGGEALAFPPNLATRGLDENVKNRLMTKAELEAM